MYMQTDTAWFNVPIHVGIYVNKWMQVFTKNGPRILDPGKT